MEWDAFLDVCRRLNAAGARYVVVGGFAILLHGYERTTRDVDLIIDASADNVEKIRAALRELLPEATAELSATDVEKYVVVRMGGEEIVVDLMKQIGEHDFARVSQDVDRLEVDNVSIPVASLETMIQLKQGLRGKDKEDLLFLEGKKAYLKKHRGQ